MRRLNANGFRIAAPSPAIFNAWVANARKGSVFIYHVGNLAEDRGWEEAPIKRVDDMGKAAWSAYEAGHVTLVQKRVGRNSWQYIARKL